MDLEMGMFHDVDSWFFISKNTNVIIKLVI